ncbi:MAG: AraC family transcriptional regulator, partial [Lachnospiraceae bacterium]|nr:AraC family transcriptional regulator [Lachnospiraceae bacterium]
CTQKISSYMEYEVSCTFYMLLTNLLIAQSKTRNTSEVIEKIVLYIQANYMKNLTADGLSHHFGLSRTHMTRCFKEYTGFAPHEYITQLRIYNAKYLLKATDLSIEDISRQTGFSDSVYFIQVFKKNRRHNTFKI